VPGVGRKYLIPKWFSEYCRLQVTINVFSIDSVGRRWKPTRQHPPKARRSLVSGNQHTTRDFRECLSPEIAVFLIVFYEDIFMQQITDKALNRKEVCEMVGLQKSRLDTLEREGIFPRKRLFGSRSVRWLQSEVLEWMQSRPPVV
jgi:prophage regulatory protein